MKYIRNLHHIDDRVLSVSPQTGKDTRVFVGIVIVCGTHKYCIPLSSPKDKHKRMRNSMDFSKIEVDGKLLGVLNFNLMIPIEEAQLSEVICNKANVLYKAYISDDTFSARDRCLDFHKMEAECKKFNTKAPEEAIRKEYENGSLYPQ